MDPRRVFGATAVEDGAGCDSDARVVIRWPRRRVPAPQPPGADAPTFLILSQVYVPDPASVGQHMHDVAQELVRRGYDTRVIAASRGYDDPSAQYPLREECDGVHVRRLRWSSFGKRSIAVRLAAGTSFMIQSIVHGLTVPRVEAVLVSTSPPMCSLAAVAVGALRGAPVKYWVMDLNPDQMIELGRIDAKAPAARAFDWINRLILSRANDVVALDRFMAERLHRKLPVDDKLHVVPPWPHDDHLDIVGHEDNPFRKKHGMQGRFVVMYSGNHSIASPLTTILEATSAFRNDERLLFAFIGGGLGKKEVDDRIAEQRPPNVLSLPYQPLSEIRYSLSAADVHLVALGDAMVGCIHPCKVYGAMAVARPILLLGPKPSHASEIIERYGIGWCIEHGDVAGAVEVLQKIAATPAAELREMGQRARQAAATEFSKEALCGRFCDILERDVSPSLARGVAPEAAS